MLIRFPAALANSSPVPNLDRALTLARNAFSVFPLRENKRPFDNSSVAAALGIAAPSDGQGGVKLATREEASIIRLWTAFPGAMIGVATGIVSGGLIVLDIDQKDGKDGLATLTAKGLQLPTTAWQQTRSSGLYYLYRGPSGQHLPTDAGVLGDGLDRRGDGGYIADYGGFDPAMLLAPAPEWLLAGGSPRSKGERRPLGCLSRAICRCGVSGPQCSRSERP